MKMKDIQNNFTYITFLWQRSCVIYFLSSYVTEGLQLLYLPGDPKVDTRLISIGLRLEEIEIIRHLIDEIFFRF